MKTSSWDDVVPGRQGRGGCTDGEGIRLEAAAHPTERAGLVSVPVQPVDQVRRDIRNLN